MIIEQPNFVIIDKLSSGDKEVRNLILDVLKSEFPIEKETYYNCFNSNDVEKTKEIVHKLKHKISILGLQKCYEKANDYEHNLVKKSFEGHKDFDGILILISEFIKKLD
jgi:hypothetical protein